MTINLSLPITHELKPKITVVGVGGAGGNAVNNMITSHLEGVEFVSCNTDAQALAAGLTDRKVQLGNTITHGLGAGARPEVGRAAAEEALDEILDQLSGSHMVFITAGMGGGTGTGAAPVIARAVREQGILTVAVVTKPFHFEGAHRMRLAEAGLDRAAAVRRHADRHPQPEPVPAGQRAHDLRRRVPDGRPGPAHGRARRDRPHGHAGPDQSRLRRHPHGDERDGQGDDGHRRGRGREARDRGRRGRDLQPAARRRVDARRPRRADQHHRRPRHDPLRGRRRRQPDPRGGRLATPTSSSARPSTTRSRAGCGSRWWRPASTCRPIGATAAQAPVQEPVAEAPRVGRRRLPLPAAARARRCPFRARPSGRAARRPVEISPATHLRAATEPPGRTSSRPTSPRAAEAAPSAAVRAAARPRSAAATCSRGSRSSPSPARRERPVERHPPRFGERGQRARGEGQAALSGNLDELGDIPSFLRRERERVDG